MKVVFQFKNKDEISNYEICDVKKQDFFIPNVNTDNFGYKSLCGINI